MNGSAGDGVMVVTSGKASECKEQTARDLEQRA